MNEYYLLVNVDPLIEEVIRDAYVDDGFFVFYEDETTLLVRKLVRPVHALTEKRMLECVLSKFRRSSMKKTITVELSSLINKHIDRLTENDCASLKFHDLFNDELQSLFTRALFAREEEFSEKDGEA